MSEKDIYKELSSNLYGDDDDIKSPAEDDEGADELDIACTTPLNNTIEVISSTETSPSKQQMRGFEEHLRQLHQQPSIFNADVESSPDEIQMGRVSKSKRFGSTKVWWTQAKKKAMKYLNQSKKANQKRRSLIRLRHCVRSQNYELIKEMWQRNMAWREEHNLHLQQQEQQAAAPKVALTPPPPPLQNMGMYLSTFNESFDDGNSNHAPEVADFQEIGSYQRNNGREEGASGAVQQGVVQHSKKTNDGDERDLYKYEQEQQNNVELPQDLISPEYHIQEARGQQDPSYTTVAPTTRGQPYNDNIDSDDERDDDDRDEDEELDSDEENEEDSSENEAAGPPLRKPIPQAQELMDTPISLLDSDDEFDEDANNGDETAPAEMDPQVANSQGGQIQQPSQQQQQQDEDYDDDEDEDEDDDDVDDIGSSSSNEDNDRASSPSALPTRNPGSAILTHHSHFKAQMMMNVQQNRAKDVAIELDDSDEEDPLAIGHTLSTWKKPVEGMAEQKPQVKQASVANVSVVDSDEDDPLTSGQTPYNWEKVAGVQVEQKSQAKQEKGANMSVEFVDESPPSAQQQAQAVSAMQAQLYRKDQTAAQNSYGQGYEQDILASLQSHPQKLSDCINSIIKNHRATPELGMLGSLNNSMTEQQRYKRSRSRSRSRSSNSSSNCSSPSRSPSYSTPTVSSATSRVSSKREGLRDSVVNPNPNKRMKTDSDEEGNTEITQQKQTTETSLLETAQVASGQAQEQLDNKNQSLPSAQDREREFWDKINEMYPKFNESFEQRLGSPSQRNLKEIDDLVARKQVTIGLLKEQEQVLINEYNRILHMRKLEEILVERAMRVREERTQFERVGQLSMKDIEELLMFLREHEKRGKANEVEEDQQSLRQWLRQRYPLKRPAQGQASDQPQTETAAPKVPTEQMNIKDIINTRANMTLDELADEQDVAQKVERLVYTISDVTTNDQLAIHRLEALNSNSKELKKLRKWLLRLEEQRLDVGETKRQIVELLSSKDIILKNPPEVKGQYRFTKEGVEEQTQGGNYTKRPCQQVEMEVEDDSYGDEDDDDDDEMQDTSSSDESSSIEEAEPVGVSSYRVLNGTALTKIANGPNVAKVHPGHDYTSIQVPLLDDDDEEEGGNRVYGKGEEYPKISLYPVSCKGNKTVYKAIAEQPTKRPLQNTSFQKVKINHTAANNKNAKYIMCDTCEGKVAIRSCSFCHEQWYCSERCQQKSWPQHFYECPGALEQASQLQQRSKHNSVHTKLGRRMRQRQHPM